MGVGVFPPDAGSGGQGGKYLELPPIIDQEVRRVRASFRSIRYLSYLLDPYFLSLSQSLSLSISIFLSLIFSLSLSRTLTFSLPLSLPYYSFFVAIWFFICVGDRDSDSVEEEKEEKGWRSRLFGTFCRDRHG